MSYPLEGLPFPHDKVGRRRLLCTEQYSSFPEKLARCVLAFGYSWPKTHHKMVETA